MTPMAWGTGWMLVSLPIMGSWEGEQDWGVLSVRGQGELTWARGKLGCCVAEAGPLEGRDRMHTVAFFPCAHTHRGQDIACMDSQQSTVGSKQDKHK